jgi:hypothetical protein
MIYDFGRPEIMTRESTMEELVLFLCGLWYWLTRHAHIGRYRRSANTLQSALNYLWSDFANRASTRDRGCMLPNQIEALAILREQRACVLLASRHFESLRACCEFVRRELLPPVGPLVPATPARNRWLPQFGAQIGAQIGVRLGERFATAKSGILGPETRPELDVRFPVLTGGSTSRSSSARRAA